MKIYLTKEIPEIYNSLLKGVEHSINSLSKSSTNDVLGREILMNLLRKLNHTLMIDGGVLELDIFTDAYLELAHTLKDTPIEQDIKFEINEVLAKCEIVISNYEVLDKTYKEATNKKTRNETTSEKISKSISQIEKLKGYITQLEMRQSEINQSSKTSIEKIKGSAESHEQQLERSYKKLLNQIDSLSQETIENQTKSLNDITRSALSEITNSVMELRNETISKVQHDLIEIKESHEKQLKVETDLLLEKLNNEIRPIENKVAEEVDKFRDLHTALRATLETVASDTLAFGNIKQAETEMKSANKLRQLGVVWLTCALVFLLFMIHVEDLIPSEGTPKYGLILFRSLIFVFTSMPGVYLLKESARHRADERRYRTTGIQLGTIDGYLASFEEEQKNTIKKELTKHYFNSDTPNVDTTNVPDMQKTMDKLTDAVVNLAKKNGS